MRIGITRRVLLSPHSYGSCSLFLYILIRESRLVPVASFWYFTFVRLFSCFSLVPVFPSSITTTRNVSRKRFLGAVVRAVRNGSVSFELSFYFIVVPRRNLVKEHAAKPRCNSTELLSYLMCFRSCREGDPIVK